MSYMKNQDKYQSSLKTKDNEPETDDNEEDSTLNIFYFSPIVNYMLIKSRS